MILYLLISAFTFWSTVDSQYINAYDRPFTFQCRTGYSISSIKSEHNNNHEDRRWAFFCQRTPGLGACSWSPYVNRFDEALYFTCPNNAVISGVSSYHDNRKEDRRFKFYCCQMQEPGYQTTWQRKPEYTSMVPRSRVTHQRHRQHGKAYTMTMFSGHVGYRYAVSKFATRPVVDERAPENKIIESRLTNCGQTGYANDWDSLFHFYVPSGRFLVGADSHHNNQKEDRRWRFETCESIHTGR